MIQFVPTMPKLIILEKKAVGVSFRASLFCPVPGWSGWYGVVFGRSTSTTGTNHKLPKKVSTALYFFQPAYINKRQ